MPLPEAFPVLFTHCIKPDLTVQHAITLPLDNQLRPRLTSIERQILSDCIANIHLLDCQDKRYSAAHDWFRSALGCLPATSI